MLGSRIFVRLRDEMKLWIVRDVPGLILRLSRKMDILATCGDELPRRAPRRGPELHHHSVEPHFIVQHKRGSGSQSATGVNGALPHLLAASIRLRLPARLLSSRRPGSHAKFLRHAA